jgi:hypothetical protein
LQLHRGNPGLDLIQLSLVSLGCSWCELGGDWGDVDIDHQFTPPLVPQGDPQEVCVSVVVEYWDIWGNQCG